MFVPSRVRARWLEDLPAVEDGGFQRAVRCVTVEVCRLTGSESQLDFEAEHGGWVVRGEPGDLGERCTGVAGKVGDGTVEGEDRPGEDAVGETAAVGDLDLEAAEHVGAVGHAGGGHAVGDEDGLIQALGFKEETYEFGSDVDAVRDDLGEEVFVVENNAEDAGFAMVERAHGVEGVGCGSGTGDDGGAGLGGGGVRVAKRHFDTLEGDVVDEGESAGDFGSYGEELDVAAGGLLEAVEEGDVRGKDVFGGVDAALDVRDEGTLEVDAEGDGASVVRGFDSERDAVEGAEGRVDSGGDGGGEEVADAFGCEEVADCGEGFGGGFHDIVVDGTVDVNVEEGGGEDGVGITAGRALDRDDPAVVVDGDDGVEPYLGGGMEAGGGEGLGHRCLV